MSNISRLFSSKLSRLDPTTQIVAYDACQDDPNRPANMPIYQTATYIQPSSTKVGKYDYTRSGNPTRFALESLVAGLEGGFAAFAFASGMAALTAVTRLVRPGEEIIACTDIYGGMYRLLTKILTRIDVTVKFVDTTRLDNVKKELTPKTRLICLETPSNPLMKVSDISEICKICKSYSPNILISVDSSMMTPLLQKPLLLGADIVVHSGTKFFAGHSDTTVGFVVTKNEELSKEIYSLQNAEGAILGPFDCWLVLRGIKTMALRLERSQENAVAVVKFLHSHPLVTSCYYPGMHLEKKSKSNRDFENELAVFKKQSKGGGSVLSFDTGSLEISRKIVDSLKLFKITVSFGSTSSLVELPSALSHGAVPDKDREFPASLIRMSIGIENINDIINDLKQAFELASPQCKL